MGSTKAGGWIGGAAFVAVVIMLVAWFFAISPTLATASDTRAQTESQVSQNALTTMKIETLKTQFATLDEIKAELAAARTQIPTSHELNSFQDQISTAALAHEVTITSVTVAPAVPLVPVATTDAAAAATDTETAATDESSTTDTEAAPAAASAPAEVGFYSMATSITVLGSYQNVSAFLQDLQVGIPRLFLVSGMTGTSKEDTDAAGGLPATVRGDLELVITGSLYALADTTAAAVVPDEAAAPPVLPVPDPGKNPFMPLG